ncbi:asparagine synthase (glutamine-hydrolyzing) [Silvanigrella paludirubra]|uniref:asparagine synthase (glutamine-hydrolyzing) n=1 Tax=Silvanigrella paludirubra TaxID=2499159 RepID=A0A6N6VTR6_9BACT|nr:asparagine synthase (glutamine-hydrolyzing) [Silvanigrella paludirubra]KAB8036839.1 asparagine synthase (glutamine-hydrolyzing) [Silvanigrella paludirubra]
MCGIFGVISKPNRFNEKTLKNALNMLSHRGPDDWGLEKFNISDKWDVWFGQRRLSILDLSSMGHQPMNKQFLNGNFNSIVFNGEIYNFIDLKKELSDKWEFKSNTDTEVILAGLNLYGVNYCKKLNGMMSLAYLDSSNNKIIFARDRLGKKPLYLYETKDCLVFSSELKAIVNLNLKLTVNQQSLAFYRWLGYIPSNLSIYNECKKLNAASFAELNLGNDYLENLKEQQYWDPFNGYKNKYKYSYKNAIDEFLELLDDATKIRLIADVPVGAFLSGGIDSSLVLSSIKKLNIQDVKAFTVKFDDSNFDESSIAQNTCKQLNFPLNLIHLKESDYHNQISKIPFYYDEPFSDSSQIPTMAISEAAKKYVSVVLTGDGGDEVFLGYPRFSYTKKLNNINRAIRSIYGCDKLIKYGISSNLGKKIFQFILKSFSINSTNIDAKIYKINQILKSQNLYQLYDTILSINPKKDLLEIDQLELSELPDLYSYNMKWHPNYSWQSLEDRSIEEKLAALDLVSYLRDDVLVKVDRGTMAYSLEARSPLLDYRIIEFGTSLPLDFKIKDGIYKRILRDSLSIRLTGNITKLQKKGFGVPLPLNLPKGANLTSSWNIFIENEWKKLFSYNGV